MKILYSRILKNALNKKILSLDSKILVVGGGINDSTMLSLFGFKNVIISNLSPHNKIINYAPYQWQKADLNNLHYKDEEFDYTIVSASLHHLYSPHRGLCEMLRVSKKGIIVIESSDNLLSKISRKLGLVPDYEIDAVLKDGTGGVENKPIPNYIYRWTKNEIKKTVNTFLPHTKNKFYFFHHYQIPEARLKRSKKIINKLIIPLIHLVIFFFKYFLPNQANEFGIIIEKGKQLHPWLTGSYENPLLNKKYIRKGYKTNI